MATKTRRNTALFYALMKQLPDYNPAYSDLIKEGIVNNFLVGLYGENHHREPRLTLLSDEEYKYLIADLRNSVNKSKTAERLQTESTRKDFVHQILKAFSRIGVFTPNGNYGDVNQHIMKLPISKGRIIPQFSTDELPNLLGAVRAYCDNIRKRQRKERTAALRN